MSTITTPRAPSPAKTTAIAFPRPRAPPVTNATPGARGPDLLVIVVGFRPKLARTSQIIGVSK
jgi:hypothetical protein